MFQSCEYMGYFSDWNFAFEWCTYQQYKIIDTDFKEIVSVIEMWAEVAIIDCYTKRGLPVAPNLIRYMMHLRDKYGHSLDWQVKLNKQNNPRWHEVEKDIQMYLMFS